MTESFDALLYVVNVEKRKLFSQGQSFAYQQGILDVVTELRDYADGKRNLREEKEELAKAIVEEAEQGKEQGAGGIYQ